MTTSTPTPDQFSGTLVGQCLGDASGFPVEGYPPDACRHYVETVLRPCTVATTRRGPYPFGQYTDDSQLARELLQSYVALGRFDPADYAGRLAAVFVEGRIVGRGTATEDAARRIAAGVPWDRAGTPAPRAGNGSAMRAGPIGLIYHADLDALARAAHDQGRITHADPRCSAGAIAVAAAVAHALRPPPLDVAALLDDLARLTAPYDPVLSAAVPELAAWRTLTPADAYLRIGRLGMAPGSDDGWRGISPFVTPSVLWSLYAFLHSSTDYWETICTAVAVGGDVDTTAAMAGAISGAHCGLAQLPPNLIRLLADRGTWSYPELVALAHQAHALAVAPR